MPFRFLSVFDWTLHKGWDVLLLAFARAFEPKQGSEGGAKSVSEPELWIKTWSSNGYSLSEIRAQADRRLRTELGRGLEVFPNIHFLHQRLAVDEMPRLYRAADAFVLPTRGEGWCRPLMEAMAAGLPTIATAWSGLTEFHDAQVGYPLPCAVAPVSEEGAREVPIYAGHRWAEPDPKHLQQLLQLLARRPESARRKGSLAQARVAKRHSHTVVGRLLEDEVERCRELADSKIRLAPQPAMPTGKALQNAVLLQAAAGDHSRMLDLARGYHESYTRAHRMRYVCHYGALTSDRSSHWDKVLLILRALRESGCEHLVWLDADTLIVDRSVDLRDALPPDVWLGMVRHGDPPWPNSGAMYIRNTPEALAFFEEIWNSWPVDGADNEAIILLLDRDPERWRGVAIIDDRWNSIRLMNECSRPVVMAWHGNGPVEVRLGLMRAAASLAERRSGNEDMPEAAWCREKRKPIPIRPVANPAPQDPIPHVDLTKCLGRPLRVQWEGDQTVVSSLALVNREFCLGLLAAGDVELSLGAAPPSPTDLTEDADPRFPVLFARRQAELSGPVDVTIRHHWPPNWTRPESGKLVVMQPWKGSHLPRLDWIVGAIRHADEVWAYSRFVRDAYVRSGVPAEKVRVVPLGVRTEIFSPEGPVLSLRTRKSIRFLFVGGTIDRKGADLLLAAYCHAFTRQDDVCLVVKDMGTETFYRGQTMGAIFRRAQANPEHPEIIYHEQELSELELAALYRSCTCVVLPYRGEGFALVPLEGMASGIPSIVTAGGSTDDYVSDSTGLRVPFHRRLLRNRYPDDPGEYAGVRWDQEPDFDALVDALRWVRDHPDEVRKLGQAAHQDAVAGWGWERATAKARQALTELMSPPQPVIASTGTTWRSSMQRKSANTPLRRKRKDIELSFCMIARDEEPRLESCLKSIAPHVDEMIVVYTGSTDRTREIAASCGARVFEFPWIDDFSAARNRSLEQALGRWIFWMDADDTISPECGARLRELTANRQRQDAAFTVQVRIPAATGEFSPSMVDHVKLFPNRLELRFQHRIHEQILPAIRRLGLEVIPTDLYVTHQNYDRSPQGQTRKRLRVFDLLRLDLRDHPDHPFVLFNLGMTCLYATREYELAARYLQRSLSRSHPQDSIARKAFALLGTARICQNDWSVALEANERGRQHYPDDPELLFQAGQLYQKMGRWEEARRALESLIARAEQPQFRSADAGLATYRGQHDLVLLFRRMGDAAHCQSLLQEVTTAAPTYLPARVDLIETLMILNQPDAARELLTTVPPAAGPSADLARLRTLLLRPSARPAHAAL